MSVLMGVVGSFVAIIAFSVLLETPGKYLWQTGVVGEGRRLSVHHGI